MKKGLIAVILSLSLLSIGKVLVNPAESKESIKKVSKEELNKKLIQAIENNNIKLVKELISKGADVNSTTTKVLYERYTPLMYACFYGNEEIVELLISKGSNVNSIVTGEYNKGFTPLMFAIQSENKEIVDLLISKGGDLNIDLQDDKYKSQLIFACENRSEKLVELLISKGININSILTKKDLDGFTALMFAIQSESKEIIDLLLSKGADVNYEIKDGFFKGLSPLTYASDIGNKEIVELLISKGANVNSTVTGEYNKGFTPLLFASKCGNKEIIELLVLKGANVNVIITEGMYKGFTPLLFAYKKGNKEIEKLLLKNSTPDFIASFEKMKQLEKYDSLKENIHYFQITIETYAVDFGGIYPEKIEELQKEAKSKNYWKEIKNTLTKMSGLGENGSIMDFNTYKNYKLRSSLKGLVLYEGINPKFDKKEKRAFCKSYKLYGTDENGELLKDKEGKIFFISNKY